MKKAYVETATGIAIAVALFLTGFFVAAIINKPFTHSGDMATWAGAFGTFVAFAGTIWVATSETRRRTRDELLKARLRAASMVLRLVQAQACIETVCRDLELCGKVDMGVEPFLNSRDTLKNIDIWGIDELIPLAPLPNNAAVQLAAASDQTRSAIPILENAAVRLKAEKPTERTKFAQSLHKNLSGTASLIEQSIVECEKASKALHLSVE